uniref:E3 ubiquitin-protein ligase Topors n=1 Tax=Periophthalmus magnuspinnatus TaxID=409849 RepID=A0A3B3ZMZ3_9GOBI
IMSAIKIALQHNQSRAKRKSGEMSTEVSPDSKCPICLDMFNNISYLDLCLHKFCFRCIHEWSKNKAECPLCKQPFNSIYHSIKSEQDFKKFDLKPADNGSFGTFGGVRFRYRTTLTGVNRHMQRTIAPPENGVMFETTNPPPQRQDRYIRQLMVVYGAHEELRPFLQGCTEHFLHEFISFAKSPFNMEAYDQHAVYDYQGPSSTDENSSNSSVIALSEDETQSVELDPPGDSNSTNMSHSMWDDETPGPSYSTQSEPSRVEHEDCVIVGFVKPTAERTPELVQLSSDSSDDEDNKENPSLRQHIRFTSVSPAVSLSSGPVDDGPSEGANIPQPNVKERHKTSSLTSQRMHTPEKRSKEAHKDARISKYRAQRMKRRSRSRDRRTPEKSYSRDRGHSHSAYYSYYKRRDSHSTYTHSSHSGSHHYYDRDGWHSRYTRSRSRSRERRRDRGRSKSYSSSRSPSVKIKSHHDKPGGKRKYKTRHLEEPYNNTTKRDLSKHRKKSKDKGQDVELHSENSPERSRRHRKKKKKHKKKSKRHKSSDPKEKTVLNIISVDSDNCADGTQDNSTNNSPSKTSPVPTLPDTEAVLC